MPVLYNAPSMNDIATLSEHTPMMQQ